MYPSDYGYATDFRECINTALTSYNSTGCYDNDFLFKNSTQWSLTPVTGMFYDSDAVYIFDYGTSGNQFMSTAAVFPSFYLTADAGIVSGSGLEGDPYVVQ